MDAELREHRQRALAIAGHVDFIDKPGRTLVTEAFVAELREIADRALDRGVRVVTLPQLEREIAQRTAATKGGSR